MNDRLDQVLRAFARSSLDPEMVGLREPEFPIDHADLRRTDGVPQLVLHGSRAWCIPATLVQNDAGQPALELIEKILELLRHEIDRPSIVEVVSRFSQPPEFDSRGVPRLNLIGHGLAGDQLSPRAMPFSVSRDEVTVSFLRELVEFEQELIEELKQDVLAALLASLERTESRRPIGIGDISPTISL